MDELTQTKAELNKLTIKYASALESIAGSTASMADQIFEFKAGMLIAQATVEELQKRLDNASPPNKGVKTDDLD